MKTFRPSTALAPVAAAAGAMQLERLDSGVDSGSYSAHVNQEEGGECNDSIRTNHGRAGMIIDILYFEGCPHHVPTRERVTVLARAIAMRAFPPENSAILRRSISDR
jgi:hypothetical protein